jgi:hypothetical protein
MQTKPVCHAYANYFFWKVSNTNNNNEKQHGSVYYHGDLELLFIAHKALVGKPEVERDHLEDRRGWKDNIKMDFEEKVCEGMYGLD